MKRLIITFFSVMMLLGLGSALWAARSASSEPSAPQSPQKAIATGDLWLVYNINSSVWPNTAEFSKMSMEKAGVYTVDFNTDDINVEKDVYNFRISTANTIDKIWDNGYTFPWGDVSQKTFKETNVTETINEGNGQYIAVSSSLQGKFTFRLDTTGDLPTLTLLDAIQYNISVSYDGGAAKELEGVKTWSDSFTIADASTRAMTFTINGESWGGGAWDGTGDITLVKGAAPVTVQGPGVFTYTISLKGEEFVLSISREEYIPPMHVSVSYDGGAAKELEGTEGPWSETFTLRDASTRTMAFTINGESWGGGAWDGSSHMTLAKGAEPVSVSGPGIFSYTLAKTDNQGTGFTLALTKAEYVTPITSLTINGQTVSQNAEENAVYTFPAMEIMAGTQVTVTDNEGNIYRAPSASALATGTYQLTGAKGQSSNLTASADLNYIFTARVAGRAITLDVYTYKISESTVPTTLLDNWDGSYTPENKETVWYTTSGGGEAKPTPGNNFLIIGNGHIGASLYGAREETMYLCDKTNFEASLDEDNSLTSWGNTGYRGIAPLKVRNTSDKGWYQEKAVRQLDLTTGVVTSAFHYSGKRITQEYLCSGPFDVIGMKFATDEDDRIGYTFELGSGNASAQSLGDGYFSMAGKAGSSIVSASIVGRVLTDGTMQTSASKVDVTDATYIYLILGIGTDFQMNNTTFTTGESLDALTSRIKGNVDRAASLINTTGGWAQFYQQSVADHQRLFNAMKFDLDDAVNDAPTDEMLAEYIGQPITDNYYGSTGHTRMIDVLLAQMGRYIAIASSRGGYAQPNNLQGLWAEDYYCRWLGDYHCNINLQMNYWPAEPTGLSETHLELFRYMKNFSEHKWRDYAAARGGKGWTHHMGLSPFGSSYTYNGDYSEGAAWNCTHIWQHYLYTRDKAFLAEYFDVLYGCCEYLMSAYYWTDWSGKTELKYDGKRVMKNTYSPEIGGGTNPAVHATQIAWQLMDVTRQAALILGKTEEAEWLKNELAGLHDGIEVGSNGLIREWFGTDNTVNDHRHLSHLMCLYPFDRIKSYSDDDALMEAARNSVLARGDTDGGENSIWCTAWKAACYARTLDGDLALRQIGYGIKKKECIRANMLGVVNGVFQIDGSCGISGAVPEMLLQSYRGSMDPADTYGQLDILPALPSAWTKGSVKGLKAVGNFTTDIEWGGEMGDGRADRVTITSHSGTPLRVHMNSLRADYHIYLNGRDITKSFAAPTGRAYAPARAAAEQGYAFTSEEDITMPTKAGDVIEIHPDDGSGNVSTGIDDAAVEETSAPVEYFNLQGIRVAHPTPGNIYIRRQGTRAEKVMF